MTVPDGYRMANGLLWPASDEKCLPAIHLTKGDLEAAYRRCTNFDVAVQAGGNCGVFPAAMGEKFKTVYTFEPDPVNFRCLCANAPAENVIKFNAALGAAHQLVGLDRKPKNVGAHQIDGDGSIPTMRIDDLALKRCDLIYLDIEGYELHALLGAEATIKRCRPVIVIEDKGCSVRYGIAEGETGAWLIDKFQYRVAEKVNRDVVLVP